MYIVEVIPLQKGIPRDTLSYFSARSIPLGSLVEIPLHSKTITGIVVSEHTARDMKATIRTGNFSLKSIISVIEHQSFPQKFLAQIIQSSKKTLVPIGTLMVQLFPDQFLEKIISEKREFYQDGDMRFIQAPTSIRWEHYRGIIRESFAKKTSVIIVVPTHYQVDAMYQYFQENFPNQVFCYSGVIPEKKRITIWEKLEQQDQPFIICATPGFALLPNSQIKTIIFESINSPYYINEFQNALDMRSVLLPLVTFLGYTRYLGDAFISVEQSYLLEKRFAFIERESKPSSLSDLQIRIVEKELSSDINYRSPFFSSKTLFVIEQTLREKKRIFVYSARKSIATVTSCRDCGYMVRCENCNHIMQLIKKNPLSSSDQVFHCSICHHEIPGMNRCPLCSGWNIVPMGVTTDSLVSEIEKLFPNIPCFQVSSDIIKTDRIMKKTIDQWKDQGGIMIATQKIIPWLDSVPVSIIASFEHCVSVPDSNTETELLWLLQNIHESTTESLIIQTKYPNQPILSAIQSQDFSLWLDQEKQLRKNFSFPPYGTIITTVFEKIKRKDHSQAKDFVKKSLSLYEHTIVSQFFEFNQTYTITATIIISGNMWNSNDSQEVQKLYQFLSSMRTHATITVRAPWMN